MPQEIVVLKTNKKKQKKKMMSRKARRAAALAVATLAAGKRTRARGKKESRAVNAFAKTARAAVNTSFHYATRVPSYKGVKGGVRITHTEYIGDLTSSASNNVYKCQSFVLNPANNDTFPWLANQAASYANYRFRSLHFHVGSLVSTATSGMFGMAATSDAQDTDPVSKYTFMQYQNAARNNVWEAATYSVPGPILRRLPEFLTADGTAGSALNGTKATGKLFVCSAGIGASSVPYGELYVSYDVELFTSQTPSADAFNNIGFVASNGNMFGAAGSDWESGAVGGPINVERIGANQLRINAGGELVITFGVGTAAIDQSVTSVPVLSGTNPDGTVVVFTTLVDWGATGVNGKVASITFRVSNAGKPWVLSASGGSYTGVGRNSIMITRDWSAATETDLDNVECKRLDAEIKSLRADLKALSISRASVTPCESDDDSEFIHREMSDSVVLAARRVLSSIPSLQK